jgi:hypothetical protein
MQVIRTIKEKSVLIRMEGALKEAVERKADRLGISFSEAVRQSLSNTYAPSLGKEAKVIRFMKKEKKA